MRISQLFGKTQRELPAEADTASHQLLLRAGMIRQIAAGVYSYLPLALRALNKIENIIRDEMDKAGGQELMMPVLQPLELWQQTGRHGALGQILFTLKDRRDRQLAMGPTHEEVITELVKYNVQSYRDLPQLLYQIQTKFRDEPRPRAGLVRAREFAMKDLYSFDADEAGLDISYEKMRVAYQNIFDRCGLPTVLVEADSGAIGGKESKEFMLVTDSGEDEIIHCSCGYAANTEKAASAKSIAHSEELLPIEEVATPGKATIEEVADFLKVPHSRTLKAVFYVADKNFVFGVIRGDLEVNETKLKNALHCTDLRMATEDEVKEAGLVPGAASPVGIKDIQIIADDSVSSGTNFIAGGNKPATHIKNVNYPRDFKADIITDIAKARAGDTCPRCGGKLASSCSLELGHIFKLGTFYSAKLGASFIDKDGQSKPIIMGCYGIGPSRLLAAIIEHHHDDKGIIWPASVAPYQIHLCPLYREGSKVAEVTEKLYADLTAAGLEVLLDDRQESPGVKFNDADLLGIPFRVTISPRSLEKNSIEVKRRSEKQAELVGVEEAVSKLRELVG
ncbi:MAG: proline--tRNA ligase [Chloroflexi bacterium]|nr:proline--tRNA ligase [Chloroflexota bacterium]